MSEQKSITVEQEVEAILKTQQLQYQSAAGVLDGPTGSFYADVAHELAQVVRQYRESKRPAPVFKVGDQVLLTGHEWDDEDESLRGTVVTITSVERNEKILMDEGDALFLDAHGNEWIVEPDPDSNWGGKVVDPKIRVGDTVRIREDAKTLGGMTIYMGRNQAGVEFEVTKVVHSPWTTRRGVEHKFFVQGDPEGNGVWDVFIEKVYA